MFTACGDRCINGLVASPMTAKSSRATPVANGKKQWRFTKRQWNLAIILNPNSTFLKVFLSHSFFFFFPHIYELACARAWPLFISRSLSSSLKLQPVSPLSRPFQATWLQVSDPGISVTYLDFLFHSGDLPDLTRRQIHFSSQGWVHPPHCSSSPLKPSPLILSPR